MGEEREGQSEKRWTEQNERKEGETDRGREGDSERRVEREMSETE